ncbi:ribosome silencing factor [Thiomonas sp.]
MDIRKLQRTIVDALEDVKAQDIEVFNTEALTSLFDRVVVASGTSNRQTRALASSVRDSVKAAGFEVRNPEGEETGEWVLVDCGAAVVHIMQPAIRAYYKLEELWGAKPVHLKLGSAKRVSAKVAAKGPDSRPDKPEDDTRAPARKTAASKTVARKRPAAKKAAAKTTPARTSPYGETAAEKKRVTRVVGTAAGARSAPAAPARKRAQPAEAPVAAKRPAARKAAPTAAKRPAAKKSASPAPAKRVAARKRAS